MTIKPPTAKVALKTLLRADFLVQLRNRRSLIMNALVPVIFLISWRTLIPVIGAGNVLSICIAVGLPATGLMGYSNSLARDRDRGVFQRLRTTPIPTWIIMTSRLIVQLAVILFMTVVTYAVGYFFDGIRIGILNFVLLLIAALVGGMSFLALGQFVVGLVKSSEAVNATSRLIYFPIAVVGALGEVGLFGQIVQNIVIWSPLGTTKTLLAAAIETSTITSHTGLALLVTVGYGIVFAAIGIKNFKWASL